MKSSILIVLICSSALASEDKDKAVAQDEGRVSDAIARSIAGYLKEVEKVVITEGELVLRSDAPSGIIARPGDALGTLPAGAPIKIIGQKSTSNLFGRQTWLHVERISGDNNNPQQGWIYAGTKKDGDSYVGPITATDIKTALNSPSSPVKNAVLSFDSVNGLLRAGDSKAVEVER